MLRPKTVVRPKQYPRDAPQPGSASSPQHGHRRSPSVSVVRYDRRTKQHTVVDVEEPPSSPGARHREYSALDTPPRLRSIRQENGLQTAVLLRRIDRVLQRADATTAASEVPAGAGSVPRRDSAYSYANDDWRQATAPPAQRPTMAAQRPTAAPSLRSSSAACSTMPADFVCVDVKDLPAAVDNAAPRATRRQPASRPAAPLATPRLQQQQSPPRARLGVGPDDHAAVDTSPPTHIEMRPAMGAPTADSARREALTWDDVDGGADLSTTFAPSPAQQHPQHNTARFAACHADPDCVADATGSDDDSDGEWDAALRIAAATLDPHRARDDGAAKGSGGVAVAPRLISRAKPQATSAAVARTRTPVPARAASVHHASRPSVGERRSGTPPVASSGPAMSRSSGRPASRGTPGPGEYYHGLPKPQPSYLARRPASPAAGARRRL